MQAHRDESMYPTFSHDLVEAMKIETDLYISEVLWSGSVRFEDLFFSNSVISFFLLLTRITNK